MCYHEDKRKKGGGGYPATDIPIHKMNFLKNNHRFSFLLDGKNIWETEYTTTQKEEGNTLTTEYYFEGGLKVTNISRKYQDFDGYEWVNHIENISDAPTGIISCLWDCDCALPLPPEEEFVPTSYVPDDRLATKIFAPKGSLCAIDEFTCDPDEMFHNSHPCHIGVGEKRNYATKGGRSCEDHAPFFQVRKENTAYFFAVGWSGQWNTEMEHTRDQLFFRSKIEDTHFRVLPGESFRTSSIVIMQTQADVEDAHNQWRRFLKTHFSLIGQPGRDPQGPLCTSIWGGMRSSSVLKRIDAIRKNNFPYEYVWMDSGWYGEHTKPTPTEFEGDWYLRAGDWTVSPLIHPDGLRDVSKAIHDAGMKFLLWFEPERAVVGTDIVKEHPEYFLSDGNEKNPCLLLNLGDPAAYEHVVTSVIRLIEELNIDGYRQDFNFYPLNYWRRYDTQDRCGITEIRHINNLYRFWDTLLERFPHLLIDNCSGGGRRLDIEMYRRSIPLWRSDFQCPANYIVIGSQCHTLSFNNWLPYSGTGTGRIYDEYRFRSAYSSALNSGFTFSENDSFGEDEEQIAFIHKYTAEYLKVRPYFSADFYPLTRFSDKEDTWCATQFHRPDEKDGLIQLFRREEAPYETADFTLRAIRKDTDYLFTDLDGGCFTVSGKELTEKGIRFTIPQKRKAKLFIYKEL